MIKIIYCTIFQSQQKTAWKHPPSNISLTTLLNNKIIEEYLFSDNCTSAPRKKKKYVGGQDREIKWKLFSDKISCVSAIQD